MEELYCIGCGAKLQCDFENEIGYVDKRALNKDKILCKRCFRLAHYGNFSKVDNIENTFSKIEKSASIDDLIILISDVTFIATPLIPILSNLNKYKNVIMLLNRYDLYKDYLSLNKAKENIKKQIKKAKLNIKDFFIIDDNIDEIFDYIDEHSINSNAYLVGLENAGKSTFINKILKGIAKERDDYLVVSKYPGTTIDLIKIPLDDIHFLIDSPGIKSEGNILNFLNLEFISSLTLDKKISQFVYQLYSFQSIIINNIIILDNLNNFENPLIFYGPSNLEIIRCKYEKSKSTFNNIISTLKNKANNIKCFSDLNFKSFEIKDDVKSLVIEGLGMFTLRKGKYAIHYVGKTSIIICDKVI